MASKRSQVTGIRIFPDVEIEDTDTASLLEPVPEGEYHWKLAIDADADGTPDSGYVEIKESRAAIGWNDGAGNHYYIRVKDDGTIESNPALPIGAEANTASNQGAGGVGLYDAKVGVDLQFRNINAGSNKITVNLDAGNKEVDIDVDETKIDHDNLLNFAVNEHFTEASIDHTAIQNIGVNTHAQIDLFSLSNLPAAAGGNIDANTNKIINVTDPAAAQDADTKNARDNAITAHAGDDDAHHNPVTANAPIVLTVQDIELKNDLNAQVTEIDTDGTLAADSDTRLASQKAIKAYVDAAGSFEPPIGIVLMYKGAGIGGGDTADITTRTDEISVANGDSFDLTGWYVCNGQSGTPNLQDKFVRCENDNVGNTGGNDAMAHTHDTDIPAYNGSSGAHSITTAELPVHTIDGKHAAAAYSYVTAHLYHSTYGGSGTWPLWNVGSGTAHDHTINHDHPSTTSGAASNDENRPAFYSLIFIIRIS